MLGHQIDDLYENFILRLLRGSGLRGLTSLDKVARDKDIQILRPLINIRKSELINISKMVFNFYVEDPSNLNKNFKRIRVRNLIKTLKIEGLDLEKLKLTIKNLKESDKIINFYVEQNIKYNSTFFRNKNICFLNNIFFKQPNEIIFRSISDILRIIGNRYYSARGKSIDNMIKDIITKKFKKTTLGGCLIEKINKTLIISREKSSKRLIK